MLRVTKNSPNVSYIAYLVSRKKLSFVCPLPSTCAIIDIILSLIRCESNRPSSRGLLI